MENINILPNELKDQILEYLPLRYAVFLNKKTILRIINLSSIGYLPIIMITTYVLS